MSFAVDTNVLLRSLDVGHAAQPVAQDALIALRNRGEILCVFPQNLIEFWAVATRPVANNGLGLTIARAEEELANLQYLFPLLPDLEEIFREWKRLVSYHQVIGKQAHDARIVAAMVVHNVSNLLTFNTDDFKRYAEITVVNPASVI
ncbi:MAG: type II toxin-antitoxin system VapC family toxin [Pyrinomonadaceae bacterium]